MCIRDSPCVTPPLIGALLFVARSGDVTTGGVVLFSLALGMGLPLLLIGTSLGKFLPKSGPILETVKHIAGFVMLGFTVWLLDRITNANITALLGGLLIAAFGLYLTQAIKLWRFRTISLIVAFLILAYGTLLTLHAVNGGSSWLQPWHLDNTQTSQEHAPLFPKVYRLDEIETALKQTSDKPTMFCLLYTSPSPRDRTRARMPSSA